MFHLLQANITQAAANADTAGSYFPVGLQLLFAVGMIGALMGVTHLLGPKRQTADKLAYAVNFKGLGWSGFWAVLMFVSFFLCGFIYIIKKGALKWED
jgi:NADH-quinone oxidoreductase subunit A